MILLPLQSKTGRGVDLVIAEKLIHFGARPPVVHAVCSIGKKTAIRLYKTIHLKSPKQGMLPYDQYWVVRSSVNTIHASIFLGLVRDFLQHQQSSTITAEILITAYELYCRVVASNPSPSKLEASAPQSLLLNINRAWQLTRQLASDGCGLVVCNTCLARHVVIKQMPKPFQQCPICDVWADKTGRRRWMTAKPKYPVKFSSKGTV
jgi:hypothetical protein